MTPRQNTPDPEGPARQSLSVILRTRHKTLRANVEVWLETHDPEALHDVRVNARRLLEGLRMFSDILPRSAKTLRPKLKGLVNATGKTRELDVFLASIREARRDIQARDGRGLSFLEATVLSERERAGKQLEAVLRRGNFDKGVQDFLRTLG